MVGNSWRNDGQNRRLLPLQKGLEEKCLSVGLYINPTVYGKSFLADPTRRSLCNSMPAPHRGCLCHRTRQIIRHFLGRKAVGGKGAQIDLGASIGDKLGE